MGQSIHSFSEGLVALSRHDAALLAVEAVFSALNGAPAMIRMISDRAIYTGQDLDAERQRVSLTSLTGEAVMGALRYIFIIEADGQRFRVIVQAGQVDITRLA